MNLPHLPPIKFAKHPLFCDENLAKVMCEFPSTPTLPMFVEAAAQSSAAFAKDETPRNGFLVLIKEFSLHEIPKSLSCIVAIERKLSLGNSSEFYVEIFEKEDDGVMYACGSLMIILEDIQ